MRIAKHQAVAPVQMVDEGVCLGLRVENYNGYGMPIFGALKAIDVTAPRIFVIQQ